MRKKSYELIPSIGRNIDPKLSNEDSLKKVIEFESKIMRLFKTKSFQFHNDFNIPELELLAIAQHHGLRTRLLDWTRSALVSLYFSVDDNLSHDDCAIYVLKTTHPINFLDGATASKENPYKIDRDHFFMPLNTTGRITAQQGLFLLLANPIKTFDSDQLIKLIIPSKYKTEIKETLALLGINKSVLYPDIDGLASYLNWVIIDRK